MLPIIVSSGKKKKEKTLMLDSILKYASRNLMFGKEDEKLATIDDRK